MWPATIRSSPGRVLGLGDDVDALLAQERDEPLAQQRLVLDDHHPHGSSARTVVPPPAGLETDRVPSSAATRWRRPMSPVPVGVGAARALVADLDDQPVAVVGELDRRRRAAGVLGGVGQRLGHDEVGGRLDDRHAAGAGSTRSR